MVLYINHRTGKVNLIIQYMSGNFILRKFLFQLAIKYFINPVR